MLIYAKIKHSMYYFFIHLTCEFLDLDFPGLVCKFIVRMRVNYVR